MHPSGTAWRFVIFIVVIAAAALLLQTGVLGPEWSVEELQMKVSGTGWYGPFLFICAFTLLTNVMFPTSVMLLAGGVALGGIPALVAAIPATLLAYALGYLLSAYFARDTIRAVIDRMGWLHILEEVEHRSAFRISFIFRYVPIPVGAQSYLLGLTRLQFSPYLIGSLAGSLPWIFIYTQMGAAVKTGLRAPFWIGLAACLILILAADRWWHRRSRRRHTHLEDNRYPAQNNRAG